jgi:hypothetical protein
VTSRMRQFESTMAPRCADGLARLTISLV